MSDTTLTTTYNVQLTGNQIELICSGLKDLADLCESRIPFHSEPDDARMERDLANENRQTSEHLMSQYMVLTK